ncbi:hypothetical protein M3Y97_00564900 [Aphelenchoides bicaudatus]|nr:hypothetical protein M3Y97_00564900 [Aphelenchoides bicaudatus]
MQRQAQTAQEKEVAEYRYKMYSFVIPAFLLFCTIATMLNLFMILLLRRTKIRNAVTMLIQSLTLSDISTSSIVAISLMYNSYLPNIKGTTINPCISLTLENLRCAGLLTATIHLLLIAVHHYTSITAPHLSKEKLRKDSVGFIQITLSSTSLILAFIICIFVWIVPIVALVLLSLSFENQGYYNCMHVYFYTSRAFRYTVSGVIFVIFVLIIICYSKILYLLKRQTSKVKSRSTETRVYRILWTAVMICTSYFVGWFPALIVFTLTCSTCDLLREQKFKVIFFLSCIQLAFILLKSTLNPIIYTLRVPEVRFEARQCLRRFGKRINRMFGPKSNSSSKDASTGIKFLPEERLLEDDQNLWSERPESASPSNTDKNSSLIAKNTVVRM